MNKVMLIGNLGSDPEVKTLASGERVCNFSLATNERWTDRSGEKKEATEWHRVTVWGKLVDVVERYTRKGSRIFVEGKIKTRTWEKPDGSKGYATEIQVFTVELLDRPSGDKASSGTNEAPRQQRLPVKPRAADEGPDYFDDDVPF